MLNYVFSIILSAVLSIVGTFYLYRYFREHDAELTKTGKKKMIIAAIAIVILLSLLACVSQTRNGYSTVSIFKRVGLLTGLTLCAIPDFKLQLIPNRIILAMLGLWVLITAIGYISEPTDITSDLLSSLVGAAFGSGILLIGRLISKNGMGMGDIKLMFVTGLYAKFDGIFGILFWGFLFALLTGVFLMITKKAKAKTTICMAPFFALGAVASDAAMLLSSF